MNLTWFWTLQKKELYLTRFISSVSNDFNTY